MKKMMIYLVVTFCLTINTKAFEEQFIKTNLISVKVFQRGAELTHTAKAKLEKGVIDLVFGGIAQNIDQNSINISAKGDLVILSISQRLNYLKSNEKTLQIKTLEDSLELLNKNLFTKQNENEVLKAEMDLLFANKEIGSKDKGVSIAELQKMAEYFRKRLTEIKTRMTEITVEIKNIQKNIERIAKQLNELNNKLNQPINELIVTVSSKSKNDAEFIISYFIQDASWQPAYDIRVEKINLPANLEYKANVKQNSGLDWNDVNIILSTRNPIQSNYKPELNPWFVDFEKPILQKDTRTARQKSFSPQALMVETNVETESIADYFEVSQTQLAAEFIPSLKYSIPSDNKAHVVELQKLSLKAKYEYYAAPKLDNNAFLVAYFSDWNDYNLLPGLANIYFENSYVGQTHINPLISKDTLNISMGRDQNISLIKQIIKDFTENKFLSSDIERTFAYEIKIRNNKTIPINILVEDQIPISKNEDIKIRLINSDGGQYNESEGKIKWNIQLDGSQSTTKRLIYSIRYPKDKIISNL